jgi:NAD/NADP transhydrogenase beta subunit
MIINDLNVEDVFDAYIKAVEWYGSIVATGKIEAEQQE